MENQNIENDYFSEPDQINEEKNLNVFIGMAFLVIWILSMLISF